MNRGGKAALLISCVGLGGCSASTSAVKVRALADPAAAYGNGSDAVAVARGQLVLGNVGLALEGFRKAQRDNPSDPAALAGIADCYSAMSRYDLAQSNYEAALAFAPHDRRLLLALATVFEREGKVASALAARAEADAALPAAPAIAKQAAVQPQPKLQAAPVLKPQAEAKVEPLKEAPKLQVAPVLKQQAEAMIALPLSAPPAPAPLRWADSTPPKVRIEASPLVARSRAPLALSTPTIVAEAVPQASPAPLPPQAAAKPVMAVGSITVALPPPRPVEHFEMRAAPLKVAQVQYDYSNLSSSVTVPLPEPRPAATLAPTPAPVPRPLPKPDQSATFAQTPAPRLERLSLGEVALVTTGKPVWSPQKDVQLAASGLRWVSLASLQPKPNVRILNAARTNLLAASARTVLLNRGWRKIAVGDAPAVQLKSEVQYPKSQATLGRRLAAQFGVAARMVERDVLVLVLGRDAVDRIARPQKS